jgi:two-component system response regulator CpxR
VAKETILVADDDRTLVTLIGAFLRKNGFNVLPAFDSMQAMSAARQAPKAIILDVNMPGGTGLEVLKNLKAMSKTSQIPVLVLSGSLAPGMADEVRGLGADEFLGKPVDLGQLHAALLRVLGHPPAVVPPGT